MMQSARGTWMTLVFLGLAAGLPTMAQEPGEKQPQRYGLDANLTRFSQKTPGDAVAAVVLAIDTRRFDYLLAHLADPDYVDSLVRDYKAAFTKGKEAAKEFLAFDRLVQETGAYYLEDPSLIKDLRRFITPKEEPKEKKDDEDKEEKPKKTPPKVDWKIDGEQAVGTVPGLVGRQVYFKKLGSRWYLENRQQ